MFTEIEKIILNETDRNYKYITRSKSAGLFLAANSKYPYDRSFYEFNHLFNDVKAGAEPICFRPILDDQEREYLKYVFMPFRHRIKWVEKKLAFGEYYIYTRVGDNDDIGLPYFGKKSNMYKGMRVNERYTLDELGITYDN